MLAAAISPPSAQMPTKQPAVQPMALSIHSGPLTFQMAASTKRTSNARIGIYFTGRQAPQLYAVVDELSLAFNDSAIDVTIIADPIAFCRGVKDAQPAVASKQMSVTELINRTVVSCGC